MALDALAKAQAEMALEEFMKELRDEWGDAELELASYKGKCKLVRGWDDIFARIEEHLNSLTSMKMSPYFKTFEQDATLWDTRANL